VSFFPHALLSFFGISVGAWFDFLPFSMARFFDKPFCACQTPTHTHNSIFCFAYMVEGASGFGTPVALAAPMLVSTGHPALESVVVLLVFNTLCTVWGAVGTPIWFGFGTLGLETSDYLEISYKCAICLAVSGIVVVPWALCILIPRTVVRQNLQFVYLSWIMAVGPAVALSFVSYEFSSLLGGITGCIGTALLIQYKVGLAEYQPEDHTIKVVPISKDGAVASSSGGEGHDVVPCRPLDVIGTTSKKSLIYKRSTSSFGDGRPTTTATTTDKTNNQEDTNSKIKPILNESTTSDSNASPTLVTTSTDNGDDQKEVTKDDFDKKTMPKTKPAVSFGANEEHTITFVKDEEAPEPATATLGGDDRDVEQPVLLDTSVHALSVRGTVDDVDAHLGPRKAGFAFYTEMIARTFPIWLVVLLLILTRVEEIGLKEVFTNKEPNLIAIHFGTYGTFRLSASLVFQLQNFLGYEGISWKYELLYVPFLIPFTLVSCLAMAVFRKDMEHSPMEIARTVLGRLKDPAIALVGALVLVQLMLQSGPSAPSRIVGTNLADWFQEGFLVVSPLLGVLGSFFSGSTTVSNLTFGEIQRIAAKSIGTSTNTMLALQAVGGSAGNGLCLSNIIAACAVCGIAPGGEGNIILQTYKYVFTVTTIATIVMVAFFFRF
jgi:L-lactate permease